MEKHRAVAPRQTAREAVYDDLIHVLDTLLWLLGEQAVASPADVRADQTGGFRLAAGALRTPWTSATYSMIRSVGADLERLALQADGRSAVVVDLDRATFDGPDGRRLAAFPSWDTVIERRGFTALVQHVLDTVGTPDRCEVAATRVLPTHRLAESIVANA
jgi:virulence factor